MRVGARAMPFTPFHFGPGALVHSAAPKHSSFLAFCGADVLVDVEPLYYMITGGYPIHRLFHTYVGATVPGVICVLLFALVCCSVPLGVWAGVRDLPLSETFTRLHAAKSCSAIAIIGLVSWCARVTWIVVH